MGKLDFVVLLKKLFCFGVFGYLGSFVSFSSFVDSYNEGVKF